MPAEPDAPPAAFKDVDKLRNADGIVVVISQRVSNGLVTWALFREFPRGGRIDRTNFIPDDMTESALEMIKMAKDRISKLKASNALPYPVRPVRP